MRVSVLKWGRSWVTWNQRSSYSSPILISPFKKNGQTDWSTFLEGTTEAKRLCLTNLHHLCLDMGAFIFHSYCLLRNRPLLSQFYSPVPEGVSSKSVLVKFSYLVLVTMKQIVYTASLYLQRTQREKKQLGSPIHPRMIEAKFSYEVSEKQKLIGQPHPPGIHSSWEGRLINQYLNTPY